MTTTVVAASSALEICAKFIPPLSNKLHKGSCGRIAVIGGSLEYVGAPFFAAMTGLRLGVDLAYVVCAPEAALPIKCMAPDVIVHPILSLGSSNMTPTTAATTTTTEEARYAQACENVLSKLANIHALVVGPGLGQQEEATRIVEAVLQQLTPPKRTFPIVIDADGLRVIMNHEHLLTRSNSGANSIVLTPNKIELSRLCEKFGIDFPKDFSNVEQRANAIAQLSKRLNNVMIFSKGPQDVIGNAQEAMVCEDPNTPRRVGGQGDVLSGAVATFAAWASMMTSSPPTSPSPLLQACYCGAFFTRAVCYQTWLQRGRSYITRDVVESVGPTFEALFPSASPRYAQTLPQLAASLKPTTTTFAKSP